MKKCILTFDLGTSSNKICLFDMNGHILAEALQNYPTYFGDNGQAEQDCEDWWNSVVEGTHNVLAQCDKNDYSVEAISFSSQMNSLVPVDKEGKVLTERCMTWMDVRGIDEMRFIHDRYGQWEYYRLCGSSVELTIMQVTKLMWLQKHNPNAFEKIYKILGLKEYIAFRLTGQLGIIDYTEACADGMMNVFTRDYDTEFLNLIGIPSHILCRPVPSHYIIGTVLPTIAIDLGLSPETKVVIGSGDGISCYIGAGGMEPGNLLLMIGTSGWITVTTDKLIAEDGWQVGITPLDNGRYSLSMHTHVTGAVTDWGIGKLLNINGKDAYSQAEVMANRSIPGAHGLLLNPSFIGGNACYPDINSRGALIGLSLDQSRDDIARAIYEASVLDLELCSHFFQKHAIKCDRIVMIGGGAKSSLLQQITADVFDLPVEIHKPENVRNAGAIGAFIQAGLGLHRFGNYYEAYELFPRVETIEPIYHNVLAYQPVKERYKKASDMLSRLYS